MEVQKVEMVDQYPSAHSTEKYKVTFKTEEPKQKTLYFFIKGYSADSEKMLNFMFLSLQVIKYIDFDYFFKYGYLITTSTSGKVPVTRKTEDDIKVDFENYIVFNFICSLFFMYDISPFHADNTYIKDNKIFPLDMEFIYCEEEEKNPFYEKKILSDIFKMLIAGTNITPFSYRYFKEECTKDDNVYSDLLPKELCFIILMLYYSNKDLKWRSFYSTDESIETMPENKDLETIFITNICKR